MALALQGIIANLYALVLCRLDVIKEYTLITSKNTAIVYIAEYYIVFDFMKSLVTELVKSAQLH